MGFDRRLAEQIIRSRDRDVARFFAGRGEEIKAFEDALLEAGDFDSAAFRIYQGPPGCGKTSLANHLADTHGDAALFVSCEPGDLSDATALLNKIRESALAREGATRRLGGAALETAAEYFRIGTLHHAVRDVLRRTGGKRAVVLHMDEAHGRLDAEDNPGVRRMLLNLHTAGMGAPCVMMLTGLGHTRRAVTSIKGLTRLARNASHDVGVLPKRDCARSTRMMLDALNVVAPSGLKDSLADLTGELAHEWPAHLNGAQVALCEELVRVGGELRDVDAGRVRDRSEAMRHDYYERRLEDHPAFDIDRSLTRRILVNVARERPRSPIGLSRLCGKAIDRTDEADELRAYGVTPKSMADALLEKGIVRDTGRAIAPSIPSMADWAADEIGVEPPRREEPGGTSRRFTR